MPSAATWMDLEIIILSEVNQREKDKCHMQTLNYNTNELIYETEADSQTERTDLQLPREREARERRTGSLGLADADYYIQDG